MFDIFFGTPIDLWEPPQREIIDTSTAEVMDLQPRDGAQR
jgi:hypothetical protein